VLGLSLAALYVSWNVYWLAAGRVPPSMLTGLTGLPAPTTGGTRSVTALLDGDLPRSLYYNAMTIPILGLLTITVSQVLLKGRGDNWLVTAWVAVLSVAWVGKLLSPSVTW
jgi:hypothetical protein